MGAIVTLSLQTELVKILQSTYDKPTFIVYCVHASFMLVLIMEYIRYLRKNHIPLALYHLLNKNNILEYFEDCLLIMGCSFNRVLMISFLLVSLYNISTLFWYWAVDYTSTNELTAIFNSGTCFAYIFSILIVNETSSIRKWSGVLVSLSGLYIIALVGNNATGNHLYGNFLGLLGAILYGLYDTLYFKYAVPSIPSKQFSYFFTGMMGLSSCTTFWIPVLYNHLNSKEIFEIPSPSQFILLCLVILTGVAFDTLFFQLISLTSPTIASAGILLSIPSVILCDVLFFNMVITWNMIIGSIILILGFFILHYEAFNTPYEQVDIELINK